MSEPLLIARTPDTELFLLPGMANRHGLITGATGTGKTVTLQKLAESLSEIGVPVFMADVKGDLVVDVRKGIALGEPVPQLEDAVLPHPLDGDGVLHRARDLELRFLLLVRFGKRFDDRQNSFICLSPSG